MGEAEGCYVQALGVLALWRFPTFFFLGRRGGEHMRASLFVNPEWSSFSLNFVT